MLYFCACIRALKLAIDEQAQLEWPGQAQRQALFGLQIGALKHGNVNFLAFDCAFGCEQILHLSSSAVTLITLF